MISSENVINESTTSIEEYDPARELAESNASRIPAGIKSCKSCVHAKVCKIYEVEAIHVQRLEELAKRSQVEIDVFPPEAIGARCSEYKAVTQDV